MRDVILFIAMSLDGYIADRQGGVAWLCGEEADADMPDTYGTFVRDIDTVIMGWNTYHQIVTELSPNDWVYKGLDCHVLTHRTVAPPKKASALPTNRRANWSDGCNAPREKASGYAEGPILYGSCSTRGWWIGSIFPLSPYCWETASGFSTPWKCKPV